MKAHNSWITYRTRFLVKARQLTTTLTFTDALGRRHSGRRGDYLVEFSDGVLRIVAREFFEDVYVPMLDDQPQSPSVLSTPESPTIFHQPETPHRHNGLQGLS
jgi:hypothetical protein